MNTSKRRIIAVVAIAAAATTLPIASPAGAGALPARWPKAAEEQRRSTGALRALAGELDPKFGGDGKVTTNFGSGEQDRASDVLIQPNGNPNGSTYMLGGV